MKKCEPMLLIYDESKRFTTTDLKFTIDLKCNESEMKKTILQNNGLKNITIYIQRKNEKTND
jgi:hypothetical protein